MNAILVAWPAAVLVPAWGVLLAVYVLVVRQPVTSLGLGVLLSLIGFSAFTRSIGMRWQPMWATLLLLVMVMGVLSGLPAPGLPAPVLAVVGIAALIAATLLNRDALGHTVTYRRPAIAIGLPPPR